MSEALLEGVLVVDLAREIGAMTGRILADLGAEVVAVDPPEEPAWRHGKRIADASELDALLARADVVIDTPYAPGAPTVDPASAPNAVWVRITPFGLTGPRASWQASDLGIMAASGNAYSTGDPDRAPVRPSEPAGYAHTGSEAAYAALTALASGRPQIVDVAAQEVVSVANMAAPAGFAKTGARGRRAGANIGRTREIWPTSDGFVSYGLRGGKARVPSLETLTRLVAADGIEASALTERDWSTYNPNTLTDEEIPEMERPVEEYFSRHTMQELYDIATKQPFMLAPINSPKEILASEQLASRDFFGPIDSEAGVVAPRIFATIRGPETHSTAPVDAASALPEWATNREPGSPAWKGLKILEFGSGAAGPIASRYFAEHGATVLRVESKARPDFLRVYALGPKNPHGLEGSPLFDGLNVGKLDVSFNLKHPDAIALVKRLILEWADAVAENFAPRAMRGFGLDYDTLIQEKPDLVMISACLNGQTGPHKDYPGFGGQGSALAGYNYVTGWPDRAPVGPHGTITDSLAPRFVAAALAAGLLYRARTGRGIYLDVSQVEAAVYSLSPWLIDYQRTGTPRSRNGNRSPLAVPHGMFPAADEGKVGDRWIAIATWTDEEWATLAGIIGGTTPDGTALVDPALATFEGRQAKIDEIEAAIAAWTQGRSRGEIAELLQAQGIEAVPTEDFGDFVADPQMAARDHFVELTHPFMGPGIYERNGFRLSDAPSGYTRTSPTLGQDQDWVLDELLGLSPDERKRLEAEGAFD
ncbi:MAG: subunit of succinyl-CoA:benzylsuccinate CoA-transferase [Actinomycetia bacterium]|nr:subunit of succinyl-CoA:benzylsuccinate CoA-transferase [Actinomycetes bacterium]